MSSTPTPNQPANQTPNQPSNQVPSQTPNQPTNPAPSQTPQHTPSQTPHQPANQIPNQVPVQVPIHTPNINPGTQQPSSNGHPAQTASDTAPPKQDQPAPLSQGQSLQQIRDSLNHAPYGLLTPDPAHQQALADAVPRNEDGTPQRHPDPNGEWAQLQNDGGLQQPGRSNNCLDNARAGLSTWFGDPQVSAPRTPDKNQDGSLDTMSPERDSYNNLDAWAGRPQIWAGDDHPNPYGRIASHLQEAGPGSAAVVGVQWPGGGGHAFNVYNHNGQIIWVDHQTGEVSPNPIHTGAAGVRYVPFDPNGQTMDAPWEKKDETAEEGDQKQEDSQSQGVQKQNGNQTQSPQGPTANQADDSPQSPTANQADDSPQSDTTPATPTPPGPGGDTPAHGPSPDSMAATTSPAGYGAAPSEADGNASPPKGPALTPHPDDSDPYLEREGPATLRPTTSDDPNSPGLPPDPAQQALRARNPVFQVQHERVDAQIDKWADPNHPAAHDGVSPLANVLRQTAGQTPDGTPMTFDRERLRLALPGFDGLNRGEQMHVVSTLARLSHTFHERHGVSGYEESPDRTVSAAAENRREAKKTVGNDLANKHGLGDSPHVPDLSEKNYAVIEVDNGNGEIEYVVDSSIPTGSPGEISARHSEDHLMQWVEERNRRDGNGERKIVGLYTEREPCGSKKGGRGSSNCSSLLKKNLAADVPIYYSSTYRVDGEVVAERREIRADVQRAAREMIAQKHGVKGGKMDRADLNALASGVDELSPKTPAEERMNEEFRERVLSKVENLYDALAQELGTQNKK
ncbi:toxin glutamine deamidase domain-containing protein [Streptomyces sp. BH097]|uniref:toxin glutamine deamidase domain-containing protein n=1 Tax=unclassified Streptomyces TaxID=2593676 RepID=UPI003BB4EA22